MPRSNLASLFVIVLVLLLVIVIDPILRQISITITSTSMSMSTKGGKRDLRPAIFHLPSSILGSPHTLGW